MLGLWGHELTTFHKEWDDTFICQHAANCVKSLVDITSRIMSVLNTKSEVVSSLPTLHRLRLEAKVKEAHSNVNKMTGTLRGVISQLKTTHSTCLTNARETIS